MWFLLARRYASVVFAVIASPSVPYHSVYTTNTATCRISETPPQDNTETLVLRRERSLQNSDEIIPNGDIKLRLLTGRESSA